MTPAPYRPRVPNVEATKRRTFRSPDDVLNRALVQYIRLHDPLLLPDD